MVLSTHSVVGAATATALTASPVVGFFVGLVSHFLLDMIPHWDYPLASKKKSGQNGVKHDTMVLDRRFLLDCLKMGVDFGIGVIIVGLLVFLKPELWLALLAGLVGGVLPDVLQFGYFMFPRAFGWIQWIHHKTHSHIFIFCALDGIFSQLTVVIAVIMIWFAVV